MGSRKDPDRIIPLGLSARDRVLPIWDPLYSSKAASWVGMLLERVILGVVAAVGLTGRTEGRGKGEGRGRQEKRQGHQLSESLVGDRAGVIERQWEGGRRGRSGRWGVGVCKQLEVRSNPSWEEGWALTEKDPMVCSQELPLMLPALEMLLGRLGWGPGGFPETFTSRGCADGNGMLWFVKTQPEAVSAGTENSDRDSDPDDETEPATEKGDQAVGSSGLRWRERE